MINNMLKNKKILIALIIFITISIVVIIIAIIRSNSQKLNSDISREPYVDPISGEMITDPRITTGGPSGSKFEPAFIGSSQLLNRGFSSNQIKDIRKNIAEYYIEKTGNPPSAISYYKDSYTRKIFDDLSPTEYYFKVAINYNTSENVFLKIVNKGIDHYDIFLYSDEEYKNEVKRYSFCSVLICKPEAPKTNGPLLDNYAG